MIENNNKNSTSFVALKNLIEKSEQSKNIIQPEKEKHRILGRIDATSKITNHTR